MAEIANSADYKIANRAIAYEIVTRSMQRFPIGPEDNGLEYAKVFLRRYLQVLAALSFPDEADGLKLVESIS